MIEIKTSLPQPIKTVTKKVSVEDFSKILFYLSDRNKMILLLMYYSDIPIAKLINFNIYDVFELVKQNSFPECARDIFYASTNLNIRETEELAFVSGKGEIVQRSHIYQAIRLACKKAGIKKFSASHISDWVLYEQ